MPLRASGTPSRSAEPQIKNPKQNKNTKNKKTKTKKFLDAVGKN
jgi:hypothetical protein